MFEERKEEQKEEGMKGRGESEKKEERILKKPWISQIWAQWTHVWQHLEGAD